MSRAYDIVTNTGLTYQQMMVQLAQLGESSDDHIAFNPAYIQAKADGYLCDLNEGVLPFRPRYICVDFERFFQQGSEFLGLGAPTSLLEATTNLQILYKHIPSITSFPVYLGNLDVLLEPYVLKTDLDFAKEILRNFLLQIDRTLTDSFVHANIGPYETVTGKLLLELTEEMQLAIPNLTLKYDAEKTSLDFAMQCAGTMLRTAKPSFANDKMFTSEWGENYAIASCYNGLLIGGGGYTLPRMKLYEIATRAHNIEEFLVDVLPYYVNLQLEFMDQRVRFLVEESAFFKSNFLVTEGLLSQERFTGMFGLVGLAECCNYLLNISDKAKGYGHFDGAHQLGEIIMNKIQTLVYAHKAPYCEASEGHYLLHAQVGIDTDGNNDAPGVRVPIGYEPAMFEQIMVATRFHKYFPTGCGDIFTFDDTWKNSERALVQIIQGAHASGMRYFSGYLGDCDVVRVTGYLVKRSELAKLDRGEQSLNQVSIFGKGARDNASALSRMVQHASNDQ
ncbi:MAG: YjjI family glycine radical enzyme [Erysipelotrichaceae bacterium]